MFAWLLSKTECPVDPATRAWIDNRWAWLEGQFGAERIRGAKVVLPRHEFFPDRFSGCSEDARIMLNRVCVYMGIDPNSVELSLYEDRPTVYEGGWRRGTAGRYQPDAGKYRIWIEVSNLSDPLAMVGTMAHELGHVHLLGHGRISDEVEDHEPLTDLLPVFLGMGVFTANSVIRENHLSAGWSIARRGYLWMPEYGYAFALFARARSEDGSSWSRELRHGVRTAFKQSMRFLSQLADGTEDNPLSSPKITHVETRDDDTCADLQVRRDWIVEGRSITVVLPDGRSIQLELDPVMGEGTWLRLKGLAFQGKGNLLLKVRIVK